MSDESTLIFEQNRRTLEGIAYRMLCELSGVWDVVQETYLKWRELMSARPLFAYACLQHSRVFANAAVPTVKSSHQPTNVESAALQVESLLYTL